MRYANPRTFDDSYLRFTLHSFRSFSIIRQANTCNLHSSPSCLFAITIPHIVFDHPCCFRLL